MIIYPARALTRLVALVVLPALGLIAGAFTVAALAGDSTVHRLARTTHLTSAWRDVGEFLAQTAPRGGSTVLLAAGGAVVVGVVLLIGALAPARERELPCDGDRSLTIRRRALRSAAAALAGSPRGTSSTKVRLRTRRVRRGGRLKVRATRSPRADAAQVNAMLRTRLTPLTTAFSLTAKVTSRIGTSRKSRTT